MMRARGLISTVLGLLGAGALLFSAPALAGTGHGLAGSFGPFVGTRSLAVDNSSGPSSGNVYVTDPGAGLVYKVTGAQAAEGKPGTPLKGVSFYVPYGVGVDPSSGEVYVADFTGNVVDKFSAETGEPVPGPVFPLKGTPTGAGGVEVPFANPAGAAVDPANGDVYVTEYSGEVVDVFTSTGAYVTQFHAAGGPTGIAFDSTGSYAYIVDANLGDVQEYSPAGVPGPLIAEGVSALGVAVDPATNAIYVAENGQVSEYAAYNGSGVPPLLLSTFGSGIVGGQVLGVGAYGKTGTVYASEYGGTSVDIFAEGFTPEAPLTEPAGEVTATTAKLNGELNPLAQATTGYEFDYNNTNGTCSKGFTTEPGAEAKIIAGKISTSVTGLQPSKLYTFCILATNKFGITPGAPLTFKTLGSKPAVDSESASNASSTSATLEAQVNPNNQETTFSFEYSTKATGGVLEGPITTVTGASPLTAGFGDQLATVAITGLTPGTTYHYHVVTENGTPPATDGTVQSFTTIGKPIASAGEAQNATSSTVRLSGTVNPTGADTTYHFVWIDEAGYQAALAQSATNPYTEGAHTTSVDIGSSFEAQNITPVIIGELLPSTTYHYAIVANNTIGSTIGPSGTFTTAPPTPPQLTTGPASNITQNTATITATINPHRLITTYGFEIRTSATYGPATGVGALTAGTSEIPVTLSLTDLQPGTTYHYRIEASNVDGTTYGTDQTFTTPVFPIAFATPPAPLPLIATPAIAFPPEATGSQTTTPTKALTRAQKLTKALKACHAKQGKKRNSCEATAHRKYGTPAKKNQKGKQ